MVLKDSNKDLSLQLQDDEYHERSVSVSCSSSPSSEVSSEEIRACRMRLISAMARHHQMNLKGMPKNIVIGSHVWVGDPELVWIDGQIINLSGRFIKLINVPGYSPNGLIPLTFCSQKRCELRQGTEYRKSLKFTMPSRRD